MRTSFPRLVAILVIAAFMLSTAITIINIETEAAVPDPWIFEAPYIGDPASSNDPIANDDIETTLLTVETVDDVSLSSVVADLSDLGLGTKQMHDDGILGEDETANDDVWSVEITIPLTVSPTIYSITFTATDGNSNTNQTTLQITVEQGNLPPRMKSGVVSPTSRICVEEESITVNLNEFLEDPDGSTLTYTIWDGVIAQDTTATLNLFQVTLSGNILTILGRENANGKERIQIDASDGVLSYTDGSAGAYFELEVGITATNDAPFIEAIRPLEPELEDEILFGGARSATIYATEDSESIWSFRGTDIDGDELTYICAYASTGTINPRLFCDNDELNLTFNPTQKDVGETEYSLSAFDYNGSKPKVDVVTLIVNVSNVNDRPTIDISDSVTVDNETVTTVDEIIFEVDVTDEDGDDLTVTWKSDISGNLGTGERINVTLAKVGTHTITATVTDGAKINLTTFEVTVESGASLTNADVARTYTDLIQDDQALVYDTYNILKERSFGLNPDLDLIGMKSYVEGSNLVINLSTTGKIKTDERGGVVKYSIYMVKGGHKEELFGAYEEVFTKGLYKPKLNQTYYKTTTQSYFFYPTTIGTFTTIGTGSLSEDKKTIQFTVNLDILQVEYGLLPGDDFELFATVEYQIFANNEQTYGYDAIGAGAVEPEGYTPPEPPAKDYTVIIIVVIICVFIALLIVALLIIMVVQYIRTREAYVMPKMRNEADGYDSMRDRTRSSLVSSAEDDKPKKPMSAQELYGDKAGPEQPPAPEVAPPAEGQAEGAPPPDGAPPPEGPPPADTPPPDAAPPPADVPPSEGAPPPDGAPPPPPAGPPGPPPG